MVALYALCFEQAWKAMKEALESSGYPEGRTGSPKTVLKTAFAAGMTEGQGAVQTAAAGNFILGVAMTAASAAGELVQVQLTKSGYVPAS